MTTTPPGQLYYAIVEFPEEADTSGGTPMALISSRWIISDGGIGGQSYCYWPLYLKSTSQREKAVVQHVEIDVARSSTCPILEIVDYERAKAKLTRLENNQTSSELSSSKSKSEESKPKGGRPRKKKDDAEFTFEDYDSGEELIEPAPKLKKDPKKGSEKNILKNSRDYNSQPYFHQHNLDSQPQKNVNCNQPSYKQNYVQSNLSETYVASQPYIPNCYSISHSPSNLEESLECQQRNYQAPVPHQEKSYTNLQTQSEMDLENSLKNTYVPPSTYCLNTPSNPEASSCNQQQNYEGQGHQEEPHYTRRKKCDCKVGDLLKLMERLCRDQQEMKRDLKQLKATSDNAKMTELSKFQEHLEFESFEDLQTFDLKLEDGVYFDKLLSGLALLGGRDVGETTRRILLSLMAPKLTLKINWIGANGKGKLQDLKNVLKLIYSTVRMNTSASSATNSEIDAITRGWIKNTSEREGGRSKMRKKKITGLEQTET